MLDIFAEERRNHAIIACGPDITAATQHQASPIDLDVPIGFYRGIQITYHPDLTGRLDSADNVSIDSDRTSGCIHDDVRDRYDSDSSLESHQVVLCYQRRSKESPRSEERRVGKECRSR